MKAARVIAPGRLQWLDAPEPELPADTTGGILVRAELGSICGSDLPLYGHALREYPGPMGGFLHECIGLVVESSSERFRPGDRILAYPDGFTGFAERWTTCEDMAVHVTGRRPLEQLLMAQPLATVIRALRKLPNLVNASIVVLGQGALGQLFSAALSNLGARHVIGVDRLRYRLEVARRMRATHTIDAGGDDFVDRILQITGEAGPDIVIEAVGHQMETINVAIELVRDEGIVLAFGVPDVDRYELNFKQLFRKKLTLIGSVEPDVQNDFSLALDWLEQGRVDVTPLITHRLSPADVQRGYELASRYQDGALKVVFDFRPGAAVSASHPA